MAEVAITRLGEQARWSLRLAPTLAERHREIAGFRIPTEIGCASSSGEKLSARLGPDEWLLCAPAQSHEDLARIASAHLAGEHHAFVDVGHRYAALEVSGALAHLALAAGCPLDLHPEAFVAERATRTLLGKAEIVLWRLREPDRYRIECARTYAPYVEAFLAEAAREFAWQGPRRGG